MHRLKLLNALPSLIVFMMASAIGAETIFSGAQNQKSVRAIEERNEGGKVKRVLDGDTFVLSDDRRVRLIGVDTPERGEPFSNTARELADSILTGQEVRIENDLLRLDRYDRILGYVFIDTIFVNELLIRRGLAHVYLFKENKRYSKRLIEAQGKARRDKVGIWSQPRPSDEPYYISAGGSFRFHRPLCTLAKNINPRKAKKYKTREAALDQGLSPCRECRP